MVEVRPGAVTHLHVIDMHLTQLPGTNGLCVNSIKVGLQVGGRLFPVDSGFTGLGETPEVQAAIEALAVAVEKAFVRVVGLSATGETAGPSRPPGLGRG